MGSQPLALPASVTPRKGGLSRVDVRREGSAAEEGSAGGFGLAPKVDALWVGTGSVAVEGPARSLWLPTGAAGDEGFVDRAFEASRGYVFGHGIALQLSLEVGLRRDSVRREEGNSGTRSTNHAGFPESAYVGKASRGFLPGTA